MFMLGKIRDRLYIADNILNKMIVLEIIEDSKLEYVDEFYLDKGSIISGTVTPGGKLVLTYMGTEEKVMIYDIDGNKVAGMLPDTIPAFNKMNRSEIMEYVSENIMFPIAGKDSLMLFYFASRKLLFTGMSKDTESISKKMDFPVTEGHHVDKRGSGDRESMSVSLSIKGTYAGFARKGEYWLSLVPEKERGNSTIYVFVRVISPRSSFRKKLVIPVPAPNSRALNCRVTGTISLIASETDLALSTCMGLLSQFAALVSNSFIPESFFRPKVKQIP